MLSQRAVVFAQRLTSNSVEKRRVARRELLSAVENLEQTNKALQQGQIGNGSAADMSPALDQIYNGGANSINRLLSELATAARSISAKSIAGRVANDDAELETINWIGPTRLLAKLDSAVSHYEAHGEDAVQWLRLLEALLWLAGIVVLVGVGYFVFAPIVRQLRCNLAKTEAAGVALAESEERFALAVQGASVGLRDHGDLKREEEYWSPTFYRMLGYTPDVLSPRSSTFSGLVHPDDGRRVEEAIEAHLRERVPIRVECRLQTKSQDYLWFLMTGQATWSEDGSPRRLITSFLNIEDGKLADKRKSEFVSTVSHELRTPLTSISGALALMHSKAMGPMSEQARRFVDIAQENCDRLIRLINDLLDVEKIEAGKIAFDFEPEELAVLLKRAKDQNMLFAEKYDVSIVLDPVPPGICIEVDGSRFDQVMANLLSNAAKYSPPRGEIRVATEVLPERVRISVSDQGPGIPESFRSKIFQKFAQADPAMQRAKSTGLGLNIAKAIVEAHGGRIGFDSTEGRGTTFYFELPLCHSAEAAKQPSTAEKHGDVPAAGTAGAPLVVSAGARPARILCVGRNGDNLSRAREALEGLAQLVVVASCEEACSVLKRRAFDLVVVDLHQPSANGEAMIGCLRECGRRLPAILLYASRRILIEAWPADHRDLVAGCVSAEALRAAALDELRLREDALGRRFKKSA